MGQILLMERMMVMILQRKTFEMTLVRPIGLTSTMTMTILMLFLATSEKKRTLRMMPAIAVLG